MKDNELVLWFDELELADIPQVGGKNASLGEMRRELIPKGGQYPGRLCDHRHCLSLPAQDRRYS